MRRAAGLIAVVLLSACGDPQTGSASRTIGVSLPDQTNDFYKKLEAGLRQAAEERGYRLIVRSAGADSSVQARQIEEFVAQGVDAIVLTPCRSLAVAATLRGAEEAGIPVFTADIAARNAKIMAHIASDNVQGGAKAGREMAALLGGKGKVLIIDSPAASSVQDRTRGFRAALEEHPGIEIVASPSAESQRAKAQRVMEEALRAAPDLNGVFAINDITALGALRALDAAGREDIVLIGYDATPEARAAIRRGGPFKASVSQNPHLIGTTTIATIANYFDGADVEPFTPVDVEMFR